MKVTDFINSKSIANYLDDLHYDFNAAEAAFIVWQSKRSVRKKYAAWQEIIDSFPDMLRAPNQKTACAVFGRKGKPYTIRI